MFCCLLEQILEKQVDEAQHDYTGGWIFPSGKVETFRSYNQGSHDLDAYKKITGKKGRWPSKAATQAYYTYTRKTGAIRYVDGAKHSDVSVDIQVAPTRAQMKIIRDMEERRAHFFWDMFFSTKNHMHGEDYYSFLRAVRKLRN